jgi:hypothetical protein
MKLLKAWILELEQSINMKKLSKRRVIALKMRLWVGKTAKIAL